MPALWPLTKMTCYTWVTSTRNAAATGTRICGAMQPWLAMPDADRDGRADCVYVAADDLQLPHSVAFYKGHMYVADHDAILQDG